MGQLRRKPGQSDSKAVAATPLQSQDAPSTAPAPATCTSSNLQPTDMTYGPPSQHLKPPLPPRIPTTFSSVGLTDCSLTPLLTLTAACIVFIPSATQTGSSFSLPAEHQGPVSLNHSRTLVCPALRPSAVPSLATIDCGETHLPPLLVPGSTSKEGDYYSALELLTFLPYCPVNHSKYSILPPWSGHSRSMVRSVKISNLFSSCHRSEFLKS